MDVIHWLELVLVFRSKEEGILAVGLNEDAVEWTVAGSIAIVLLFFFQAEDGIRDHEAEVERRLGVMQAASEAMQEASQPTRCPMLAQKCERVIPGILTIVRGAAMDHDWLLRRSRKLYLAQEDLLLRLARRVIVKIVEPDLAPGNHLGMARKLLQLHIRFFRCILRFVRMNADGGEDPIMLFGEIQGAPKGSRLFTDADSEDRLHAGVSCALQDGV